jgi:RimJ/RimL family protein N-acetyltransferase
MILAGTTIDLVPLELAHIADFLKYSAETSLWTWWSRPPPLDEPAMRKEVELALAQKADGSRLPFSIYHRQKCGHIGSTSLMKIDRANRSAEIGATWLGLPFHRSGINRECKELLLRHAFEVLALNRVGLQTDELNARSRRAIEKLGAKFEGILRQDKIIWDGRVRSSAIYSILRDEWRPSGG